MTEGLGAGTGPARSLRSKMPGVIAQIESSPTGLAGMIIITMLVLSAIAAPIITPYGPTSQNVANVLQPPSSTHLLGTDQLGRDILSRILYGVPTTLFIALLVVVLAGPVGSL